MHVQSAVKSLRRYARAVTLSQPIADRLVARALTATLRNPLPPGKVRLTLFVAFHEVWQGEQATFLDAENCLPIDRRLNRLDRHHRAALLLTCMEEFSLSRAAAILSRPVAEVGDWREQALQQATWWPEIVPALEFRRRPLAAA